MTDILRVLRNGEDALMAASRLVGREFLMNPANVYPGVPVMAAEIDPALAAHVEKVAKEAAAEGDAPQQAQLDKGEADHEQNVQQISSLKKYLIGLAVAIVPLIGTMIYNGVSNWAATGKISPIPVEVTNWPDGASPKVTIDPKYLTDEQKKKAIKAEPQLKPEEKKVSKEQEVVLRHSLREYSEDEQNYDRLTLRQIELTRESLQRIAGQQLQKSGLATAVSVVGGLVSSDMPPLVQCCSPPPLPPDKYPRARGRKAPKNLEQLRAASVLRHGARLKALPKATAASYDLRTLGVIQPIVDQGQCGSCWDFSGTGMVCSAMIKAGYGKADGTFMLSEQYTLDCGQNGGCNGDDNTTVLDWAKTTGLPTTNGAGPGAGYPAYSAQSNRCAYTSAMQLYKLADWGFCTTTNTQGVANTQDVKNAMVAYGAIGTGVAAGSWGDPGSTVMVGNDNSIDHDVIIVGWDDTKGNGGAWIVRNSWGTGWGVGGYCYIQYGSFGIATEAVWCTATALPPPPPPPVPLIASPTSAAAVVGLPFSTQIVASNSPTSYGATGLPNGLTVDPVAGLISGKPTATGVSTVTLTATNAAGSGTGTLTLTVTATPPPPPTPGGVTQIVITGPGVVGGTLQGELVPPGTTAAGQALAAIFAGNAKGTPMPMPMPQPTHKSDPRIDALEKRVTGIESDVKAVKGSVEGLRPMLQTIIDKLNPGVAPPKKTSVESKTEPKAEASDEYPTTKGAPPDHEWYRNEGGFIVLRRLQGSSSAATVRPHGIEVLGDGSVRSVAARQDVTSAPPWRGYK